jgi:hypothetical protein
VGDFDGLTVVDGVTVGEFVGLELSVPEFVELCETDGV